MTGRHLKVNIENYLHLKMKLRLMISMLGHCRRLDNRKNAYTVILIFIEIDLSFASIITDRPMDAQTFYSYDQNLPTRTCL
jgi:hypothetical protein